MKRTFVKYKKYQGTIQLKGLEVIASNNQLSDNLKQAGFTNVEVKGTGNTRVASGVWSKETQEAELPKQVVEINEL